MNNWRVTLKSKLRTEPYPKRHCLTCLLFITAGAITQGNKCEYLRKAGETAQKSFANDVTLEYYGMLLPLLTDAKEKTEIHLKRGQVLELMGKWDEAESDYRAALELSKDQLGIESKHTVRAWQVEPSAR